MARNLIYPDGAAYLAAPRKAVALIGMSGVGKTRIAALLRETGDWFHYSVDYRIGTRYLDEAIVDNFKREAMKNPFLADLLRSDSIYIASNLSFHNLAPLSTWLGMPGDPARGGIPIAEYRRRQALHRAAEIAATIDASAFITRARDLYQYNNFLSDTSGSICEIVDPHDPEDPVLCALAPHLLPVYIRASAEHEDALKARFDRAPKPIYYRAEMLDALWAEHLDRTGEAEEEVDPGAFIRAGFARQLLSRPERYQAIADNWGVTVALDDVVAVQTPEAFDAMIARALDAAAQMEAAPIPARM